MAGKNNLPLIASVLAFFTGFIGPLIMLFVVDKSEVRLLNHIKNILNFQFSYFLWIGISAALIIVLVGIVLLPIVLLMNYVFLIILIIRVNQDQLYKIPLSINFFGIEYDQKVN